MPHNIMPSITLAGNYVKGLVTLAHLQSESEGMQLALQMAASSAETNILVLITGESGTGKNLLAQAVHNMSPRKDGPLVVVNCSAIPDTLLESELFGHVKGAFTGAERTREGRFAEAEHGTLVLDEIGDMSPQAQAKVLHAIEYKQYTPVGGTGSKRADVRIVALTNRDLVEMVEHGAFRQDLFFRLNELVIEVPPLRSRREDIPLLLEQALAECNEKFNKQVPGLDPAALDFMLRYDWPGNVRELNGAVKRAVTLCQGEAITLHDLGLERRAAQAEAREEPEQESLDLATCERRHIERVLRLVGFHKSRACQKLGISRPTLDRKIAGYGIEIPSK